MLQDLQKAEQRGQTLALHQTSQIDAQRRFIGIGANADMAEFVDVVVIIAPLGNVIGMQHLAGILVVRRNLLH